MFPRVGDSVVRGLLTRSANGHELDAAKLVKIAMNPRAPESEREAAWAKLIAIVSRVARCVAQRRGKRAYDHADDAPGFIFQKVDRFDASRGNFEGWCNRVLSRRFIDRYRRLLRDAIGTADTGGLTATDGDDLYYAGAVVTESDDVATERLDSRLPFSPADLECLRTFDAEDRLAIVIAFGLWRKVPLAELTNWVREIPGTAKEFPFGELEDTRDPEDRLKIMAKFLNRKYNSVYQRMKRKAKKMLPRLRFAREYWPAAVGA